MVSAKEAKTAQVGQTLTLDCEHEQCMFLIPFR